MQIFGKPNNFLSKPGLRPLAMYCFVILLIYSFSFVHNATPQSGSTKKYASIAAANNESRVYFPQTVLPRSKSAQWCQVYTVQACNGNLTTGGDTKFSSSLSGSIVSNWKYASLKEYPYMALIAFGNSTHKTFPCCGSLISENFVLGDANCASSTYLGGPQWIRLGELDHESVYDGAAHKDIDILKPIFIHPHYDPVHLQHNIALYRLSTVVQFSEHIRPICLHTSLEPVTDTRVTGWGSHSIEEAPDSKLVGINLTIFPGQECAKLYNGDSYVFNEDSMICAGVKEAGKDACHGFSGAPLLSNLNTGCPYIHDAIGFVSYGTDCGRPDYPGVYTKISYYLPWIESHVWK